MPFPPTPSNTPSNTPTPSITPSHTPTNTPTQSECPVSVYQTLVNVVDCNAETLDLNGWELTFNTTDVYNTLTPNTTESGIFCGITDILPPVNGRTYRFDLTQIPFGYELCESVLYSGITWDRFDIVIQNYSSESCVGTDCTYVYLSEIRYYLNDVLQYVAPQFIDFVNYPVSQFGCPSSPLMFDAGMIFNVKRTYETQTPTPTNTQTQTPSSTIGATPTQTSTPTSTPQLTQTPTPTATIGSTPTPTPSGCNNVTSVFGYMEPCIGGTIDDYMGAAVFVDSDVSVDTNFNVDVYYVLPGTSCASSQLVENFNITIPAGFGSSNFNACNDGPYFGSGAVICGACINSCDNPNICIGAEFLC